MRVIPGGVDVERFRPLNEYESVAELRRRLRLPLGRPILLTVRRLAARMGLENLIRAVALVTRKNPDLDFLLVIAGKGSLAEKLAALVQQQGIEHRVRLTGFVESQDLPLYYRSADLFILPSESIEGFGLATVEALASGVPVLGTPVGGTVEILRAIDDRLLFGKATPEIMARHIEDFLKNPVPYKILRNRCRQEAVARYSWDSVVDCTEEEFKLVAGHGGWLADTENPGQIR